MKTMTLAVLALLVACAAQSGVQAEPVDCTARHGPGCLQCENVTITAPDGHRHQERGYRGGWRGRRLKHGGRDGWGPAHDTERSRLVCMACDTGYILATRPNSTYGSCRCASGWGSQPVTSGSTDAPWWQHRQAGFKCVDCSAEGKVPLTDKANLKLSWDGSNWVLVLADGASSSSVTAQHHGGGRGWYQGWGAWGVPPPFRAGDCVTCPTGSTPSNDHTSCVADDTTFMDPDVTPSPSPAAEPPTPDASPAPPSTEYGACLTVSTEDIDALELTISEACSADASDAVPLDMVGVWSDDPYMGSVWFATEPQVMSEAGLTPNDLSMAECSLMAGLEAGSSVRVTWLVNDTGITCSPATGEFTFTIPAGLSQSSSQQVAGLVAMMPVNEVPVPSLSARRAAGPSFSHGARKAQQPASQVPTGPAVVASQPVLAAAATAAGPVEPPPAAAAAPAEVAASTQVVAQSAIAEFPRPVQLRIAPSNVP